MRFECPLVSGPERRDVPGTQRVAPLPDFHSTLNCNADDWSLDAVTLCDGRHFLGIRGGDQDARRTFVEGEQFGAQIAVEIDLRANARATETALRKRDCDSAVAEIVR